MLSSLKIQNFRNLTEIDLELNPRINLFYGNNGSGKTSLLEAIHFLGLARSFRTHLNSRLIQNTHEEFSIHGLVSQENIVLPIGIQRSNQHEGKIRVGGKNELSPLALAKALPLQFVDGEAHHLLLGGSKSRRHFLDWGVFHVEHSFISAWQKVTQALKQRNAALRSRLSSDQIKLWENELVSGANELHRCRNHYMEKFLPEFANVQQQLLPESNITVHYHKGWSQEQPLDEILARSRGRDTELGYTQFGPQRADLLFKINQKPAHDMLSQGQQKALTYALRLTQGILLTKLTSKACIYLIDDMPSELDKNKQLLISGLLANLNSQIVITGIHQNDLAGLFPANITTMFHVEHGNIIKLRS